MLVPMSVCESHEQRQNHRLASFRHLNNKVCVCPRRHLCRAMLACVQLAMTLSLLPCMGYMQIASLCAQSCGTSLKDATGHELHPCFENP